MLTAGSWPVKLHVDATCELPGVARFAASGALATGFGLAIDSVGPDAVPELVDRVRADAERQLERMSALVLPDIYLENARRRIADIAARRQRLSLSAWNDTQADWLAVIAAAAALAMETASTLIDPQSGEELRGTELGTWMHRMVEEGLNDLAEEPLGEPFTDWAAAAALQER